MIAPKEILLTIDGQPCRFRTCYDTTVWPIQVASATFQGQPFTAPTTYPGFRSGSATQAPGQVFIHELTHGTLYVKDGVSYNENLASFVGDEGAIKIKEFIQK